MQGGAGVEFLMADPFDSTHPWMYGCDESPPKRGWGEEGNLDSAQIKAFQGLKSKLVSEGLVEGGPDVVRCDAGKCSM